MQTGKTFSAIITTDIKSELSQTSNFTYTSFTEFSSAHLKIEVWPGSYEFNKISGRVVRTELYNITGLTYLLTYLLTYGPLHVREVPRDPPAFVPLFTLL